MRKLPLTLSCFVLAALALSGCGRLKMKEREAWRREAELSCLRSKQLKTSDYVRQVSAIQTGDSVCGADYPLKVKGVEVETTGSLQAYAPGGAPASGSELVTGISPEATLVCPMVVALDRFVAEVVQPAALSRFGQAVVEVKTFGSYSCRPMNNQRGAALSEHGFANAIDVAGFRLADGRYVSVKAEWKSGPEDSQAFLREVHQGACSLFTTVLGPGADMFHYDHIHMDLARHGAKGTRTICKPVLPPPPPPGPLAAAAQTQPWPFDPATVGRRLSAAPGMSVTAQPEPLRSAAPLGATVYNRPAPPHAAYRPPPVPAQPTDDEFDPTQFDLPEEPNGAPPNP